MQDVALLTGEQGVAYIPIAKARGITPRVIIKAFETDFVPPHFTKNFYELNTETLDKIEKCLS